MTPLVAVTNVEQDLDSKDAVAGNAADDSGSENDDTNSDDSVDEDEDEGDESNDDEDPEEISADESEVSDDGDDSEDDPVAEDQGKSLVNLFIHTTLLKILGLINLSIGFWVFGYWLIYYNPLECLYMINIANRAC